jgi:SNF2 family DNA or RNA helicase
MLINFQIENDIYVDLSSRQQAMYKALLANVSVADLLEKAANIGDADSARSLMNLVMQFRKVGIHISVPYFRRFYYNDLGLQPPGTV